MLIVVPILLNISQFDEQKDQVLVEQILQVVFLEAEGPSRVSSTILALIHVTI